MWLCTKYGFFSITKKKENEWHVRGRAEADLEALRSACNMLHEIHRSEPPADYRWRMIVEDQETLNKVFETLAATLDYNNFKGMIAGNAGQRDKLNIYHGWWDNMCEYQEKKDLNADEDT